MVNVKRAEFLLKAAIAFSLIYAALAAFTYPENWIGWFPRWVLNLSPFSQETTLAVFSTGELLLAAALFVRASAWYAALASGVLFIGITVLNLAAIDIVFRDISLALAAFALAILVRSRERWRNKP